MTVKPIHIKTKSVAGFFNLPGPTYEAIVT